MASLARQQVNYLLNYRALIGEKHLCHTIPNKLQCSHAWGVCLQIAEGLQFLHADANLVHRNVCPETVVLTESGSWKLSGLGFAMMAHFGSGAASVAFDYASGSMSQTGLAGKVRHGLMGVIPCICCNCLQTSPSLVERRKAGPQHNYGCDCSSWCSSQ